MEYESPRDQQPQRKRSVENFYLALLIGNTLPIFGWGLMGLILGRPDGVFLISDPIIMIAPTITTVLAFWGLQK